MKKKLLLITMMLTLGAASTGCHISSKEAAPEQQSGEKQESTKEDKSEDTNKNESNGTDDELSKEDGTNTHPNDASNSDGTKDNDIHTILNNTAWNEADYTDCLADLNGCAIFYSPDNNVFDCYNLKKCQEEVSPYSTFKIVGTLMGLNNQVLIDKDTKMDYDGKDYINAQWNKDLTLREAYQTSCVWYFRKVIDKVGQDKVSEELEKIGYGNCDCSEFKGNSTNSMPELNGFWLNSSLKISPMEQIEVLYKIFNHETIYTDDMVDVLKEVMWRNETQDYVLYGKTGSGPNNVGWFVGFYEKDGVKTYCALYLDEQENKEMKVSGPAAEKLMNQIIEKHYIK